MASTATAGIAIRSAKRGVRPSAGRGGGRDAAAEDRQRQPRRWFPTSSQRRRGGGTRQGHRSAPPARPGLRASRRVKRARKPSAEQAEQEDKNQHESGDALLGQALQVERVRVADVLLAVVAIPPVLEGPRAYALERRAVERAPGRAPYVRAVASERGEPRRGVTALVLGGAGCSVAWNSSQPREIGSLATVTAAMASTKTVTATPTWASCRETRQRSALAIQVMIAASAHSAAPPSRASRTAPAPAFPAASAMASCSLTTRITRADCAGAHERVDGSEPAVTPEDDDRDYRECAAGHSCARVAQVDREHAERDRGGEGDPYQQASRVRAPGERHRQGHRAPGRDRVPVPEGVVEPVAAKAAALDLVDRERIGREPAGHGGAADDHPGQGQPRRSRAPGPAVEEAQSQQREPAQVHHASHLGERSLIAVGPAQAERSPERQEGHGAERHEGEAGETGAGEESHGGAKAQHQPDGDPLLLAHDDVVGAAAEGVVGGDRGRERERDHSRDACCSWLILPRGHGQRIRHEPGWNVRQGAGARNAAKPANIAAFAPSSAGPAGRVPPRPLTHDDVIRPP